MASKRPVKQSVCLVVSNPEEIDFRPAIQKFIEDQLPELVERNYRYCESQWRRFGIDVRRDVPQDIGRMAKIMEGNTYGVHIVDETSFEVYIWNMAMEEYDCLHCKVIE